MASGPPQRRRTRAARSGLRDVLRGLAERLSANLLLRVSLGATVLGSVLAIGAVHVPVALGFAAFATFTAVLALVLEAPDEGRSALPGPAWIPLALALYSALQAVPLPLGLLEVLAPANSEVWSRAHTLLGQGPTGASLSLDPGASLVEAAKWAGYAGVLVTAAVVSRARGAAFGITLVFASATAAALVTLLHGLLGLSQVYGVYAPTFQPVLWHVGPLLNPNNLAGYLNLGFLSGAGMLLARKSPVPVWALGAGLATILGVGIISASRGGVLALPIGLVLLLVALRGRLRERDRGDSHTGRALLVVVLAAGTLFAILGATSSIWDELYSKNAEKLTILGWIVPVISDHPVFGVGRGAFESVFPAYHTGPGNVLYAHAENFALSWAVEWGLPVSLAALLAFGWVLRPRPLGVGRSAVATGAWAGLFVVLLQNLFDLALEVPAVCFALAVILGSLWGDRRRRGVASPSRPTPSRLRLRPVHAAALLAIVAVPAIVAAFAYGPPDVATLRKRLQLQIAAADLTRVEVRAELRAGVADAVERVPAEPYFPLVGALVAQAGSEESPLPWVARALERAPGSGRAHLLLADILASRGAVGQALFELRLAQEADASLFDAASGAALRWARSYDELLPAIPAGRAGGAFLDAAGSRLSRTTPAERRAFGEQCDRAALERDPSRPLPRQRLALAMLAALEGDPSSTSCPNRASCEEQVERHAEVLAQSRADVSISVQLRARLLVVRGNVEAADALLAEGCDGVRDRVECLQLRLRIASLRPDDTRLSAVEKELRAAACLESHRCAEVHAMMADVRAGRRDHKGALAHLERAAEAEPTEPRVLRAAEAAVVAGEHARAATLFERVLARRGGRDAALEARIATEKGRLIERLVQP
jgi:hypothetical protein